MSKLEQLLKIAQHATVKAAFVDPASAGGAPPGGAPPMDPSMAGGAPPMDPSMAGGGMPMDPSMAGAAPPMDPSMAGGAPPAGGVDPTMINQMVTQAVQQAMAAQGGGGGAAAGGGGMLKPKIDVNVEIMQMKKLIARIADSLGVQIPASEMVATPQDLTAMAQQSGSGGGAGGGGGGSSIPPIAPIQGASPDAAKQSSHERLGRLGDRAAALAMVISSRKQ